MSDDLETQTCINVNEMSYLNLPRLHFSGEFQADPATINNAWQNYNPKVYPSPNALEKVQLYWNPIGTGTSSFKNVWSLR